MLRLFLAVDLSDAVRQSLAQTLSWMKEYEESIKRVPVENYHVTLKFLGATDKERLPLICSAVEAVAKKSLACELKINGWGVFPEEGHPKVFWAGVEPADALGPVFQHCENVLENLGYSREPREFESHVTVARTGRSHTPADFLMRWRAMGPVSGQVNFSACRITLYESVTGGKASLYRPLEYFELG